MALSPPEAFGMSRLLIHLVCAGHATHSNESLRMSRYEAIAEVGASFSSCASVASEPSPRVLETMKIPFAKSSLETGTSGELLALLTTSMMRNLAREALREAGVGTFLHKGCDMIEILTRAHDVLGVKVL